MSNTGRTTHTPGPWQTYGTLIYAPGDHAAVICEVSEPRATGMVSHTRVRLGSNDEDEAFANAHLISAAPELLESVTDLLRLHIRDCQLLENCDTCIVTQTAKAAIAKAQGKLPRDRPKR
jgi:hypothetical protein